MLQTRLKKPLDGVFGVQWSQVSESCLRAFVDEDHRLFERINEREISNLPMYLVDGAGTSHRVCCMDFSPIGFRMMGLDGNPIPTPGDTWKICIPNPIGGELEIKARMVWAHKRARMPNWEAGLERCDIGKGLEFRKAIPSPSLALDYPGSGLVGFLSHPLLFQEWIRCEIIQLSPQGDILLASTDSMALAFPGDRQSIRLATPTLSVKPHLLEILAVGVAEGSYFIQGKISHWKSRHAKNMAMDLHHSGIIEARELVKAGFDWSLQDWNVDVQGLSMGIKSDRRVLGAFVDGKLVATLAYCLPDEKNGALTIEGLSLQTVALNKPTVHSRLFTLAARALLLSEQDRLEIVVDPSQLSLVEKAGFSPRPLGPPHPLRYVLSRNAVLWGLGPAFLPWLRGYHAMVEDLLAKGLYRASWPLKAYLIATRWMASVAKSWEVA